MMECTESFVKSPQAWLMREFVTGQNLGRWQEHEPRDVNTFPFGTLVGLCLLVLPRSLFSMQFEPKDAVQKPCCKVVQSSGQISLRHLSECDAFSDYKVRTGAICGSLTCHSWSRPRFSNKQMCTYLCVPRFSNKHMSA